MNKWAGWPAELRPKQLLFFSADVVGSTQLKQTMILDTDGSVVAGESQWLDLIQDFYIAISEYLFAEFEQARNCYGNGVDCPAFIRTMKAPRVWKTIGDEVLFWVEITDSRQVEHHIRVFIAAIRALRAHFTEKYELKALNWKCTAWMAHFPWRNKMIFSFLGRPRKSSAQVDETNLFLVKQYFSKKEPPPESMLDFVGPGIDLGFRLTTMSNARRFTISTDVAYLLARTTLAAAPAPGASTPSDMAVPARMTGSERTTKVRRDEPVVGGQRIHFDGLKTLKGVHGGNDYPAFWIDMLAASRSIEDYGRDLVRRPPCSADAIIDFADDFYEGRKSYVYPPFVVSETETVLTQRPLWYDGQHQGMLEKAGYRGLGTD